MPPTHLQVFQRNTEQKEAVRLFMIDVLKGIAVEKTFNGENVEGIKEARELVEKLFDKLDELYGDKPKAVVMNSR